MMKKTTELRRMVTGKPLEFLVDAHNGLSAKIAEEAGFRAVWAGGLGISAALGVRDNNEASWTQILEVAEFMNDAIDIPVLVDGDTGFGNFNNTRRLVKKLEQRGIAGVCIEDKQFPKTNSFLRNGRHQLVSIEEFCGKIMAGKDAQTDADFVLVARTEALIAGHGLAETLRRAEAYHEAGADAILVHSRQTTPDEVFSFIEEWGGRCPVVLVPTTYGHTPADAFRAKGVSVVIRANHLLRAALRAMQTAARQIHQGEAVIGVEDRIAPLNEVFRLQGDDELRQAEQKYMGRDEQSHADTAVQARHDPVPVGFRRHRSGQRTGTVPTTDTRGNGAGNGTES